MLRMSNRQLNIQSSLGLLAVCHHGTCRFEDIDHISLQIVQHHLVSPS